LAIGIKAADLNAGIGGVFARGLVKVGVAGDQGYGFTEELGVAVKIKRENPRGGIFKLAIFALGSGIQQLIDIGC
jgi:hypothetical protein